MTDTPLGRRPFAAALAALLASLAGCFDDDSGDGSDDEPAADSDDGEPDVAIDLSDGGLGGDPNETETDGNASDGAGH